MDGDRTAFAGAEMVAAVTQLIARARGSGSSVIFVQHQDEYLAKGSESWELIPELDVQPGDLRIEKRHGSAFHGTPLREHLEARGTREIVLCGMQTEFCIDSTFRHALTLGFRVEVAQDGHTTHDSALLPARQIVEHHNGVFSGYGSVLPAASIHFR